MASAMMARAQMASVAPRAGRKALVAKPFTVAPTPRLLATQQVRERAQALIARVKSQSADLEVGMAAPDFDVSLVVIFVVQQ